MPYLFAFARCRHSSSDCFWCESGWFDEALIESCYTTAARGWINLGEGEREGIDCTIDKSFARKIGKGETRVAVFAFNFQFSSFCEGNVFFPTLKFSRSIITVKNSCLTRRAWFPESSWNSTKLLWDAKEKETDYGSLTLGLSHFNV